MIRPTILASHSSCPSRDVFDHKQKNLAEKIMGERKFDAADFLSTCPLERSLGEGGE